MRILYTFVLASQLMATAIYAQLPFPQTGHSGIRVEMAPNTSYILSVNGRQFALAAPVFMIDGLPTGMIPVQVGYYTGHGWNRQFITTYSGSLHFLPGQRLRVRLNLRGQLTHQGYEDIFPHSSQCPPIFPHQPQWHPCPPTRPQFPGGCSTHIPGGYHPQQPHFPGYPSIPQGFPWGNFAPMNQSEFNQLLLAIRNRSFDSDKLLTARQAVRNTILSAAQIRQVMELFSFESTKLEFAKLAYDHCFDKQNYFMVYDAFTFSGSIHSLDQYIARR